jgi:TnpA family transposase
VLQQQLTGRLPAVDLPQLMLDVHRFTGFASAFTHLSRTQAHVNDFPVSLCAVLLAQGCNIGLDAVANEQVEALTVSRLRWVQENYVRPETLIAASDRLVNAQTELAITQYWGGGEVASADGIRFVVPKHALHGRFNRKYFGTGRGVTFFNFMSDQFTGFHHVVIPGTLREALYILDGMLDHTTDLQPQTVMTDTNSYTDIVFGLFWLLGFQFSPRLADLKSMRFWRMDRQADHGVFNAVARSCISLPRIYGDWDDMLRVSGSLKTGTVTASNLMRIFSTTGGTSSLTRSIRDVGRIAKSLHMLHYLRDEAYRRRILTQLNHTEQRHKLARRLAYGNRGELKQAYREGQEEQLGALGLLLNLVVYWNTVYLNRALDDLLQQGGQVDAEAISRITPLSYDHIRILGRYSFPFDPDETQPRYRPLRPMTI